MPHWLEVAESQGDASNSLGFVSFRILGWRHVVLVAARPWEWLHIKLLHHWTKRLPKPVGGWDDGPPDADVREPRRPSPLAGSGAAAIPEPNGG
jgi:hypothetical protein